MKISTFFFRFMVPGMKSRGDYLWRFCWEICFDNIRDLWHTCLQPYLTITSYINSKKKMFPLETMLKEISNRPWGFPTVPFTLNLIANSWKVPFWPCKNVVGLFSLLNAFEIKLTLPNHHLNHHSVRKVCNLNLLYVAIWSWSQDICSE